jgi:hypothetical protein
LKIRTSACGSAIGRYHFFLNAKCETKTGKRDVARVSHLVEESPNVSLPELLDRARPSVQQMLKAVEKGNLRRIDLSPGEFVGEELCAVDFRKGLTFARAQRPFQFESVATNDEQLSANHSRRPPHCSIQARNARQLFGLNPRPPAAGGFA